MPNSSRPSRIPSTNATPNSRNGSATTSIPTPTTPKGSPRKFPPSPKLGLGSPPANTRDAANPRPSPDAYEQDDCAEPALADRLHLPEGDWLGLVLSVNDPRRLLALHHRLEALHHDERRGRHRHVEAGSAGFRVGSGYGDASTSSAIGQRVELRLRRPGQMARAAGHATYAWCALSSDDAGENRALASNAQEPHPARELLSARRSRSSDRCIRRVLQPPALSREHRQSHPGRRLLPARSNHPAGKRKDQTQDHPKPSVASPQTSRATSTMMRQTLSWFRPPPVSKSLTTDSSGSSCRHVQWTSAHLHAVGRIRREARVEHSVRISTAANRG